jgi:exopolyphosphatase/guanosine-5'-triphosphate,3'-diphosphate pyrophosphatase
MRLASIDLGSNTIHLLVVDVAADGGWRIVEHDQQVTRLGEGLARAGRLADAPMARTRDVVLGFVRRAERAGAREIAIVATSAVREAANGAEFAADLGRRAGHPVRVVSGDDEARLTVRGVLRGLRPVPRTLRTFDIGGGSTEYVLARDARVVAAVSLRLGVVPLAERYPFPGPVDAASYRQLEDELRARLAAELPPAIREATVEALVGTAGTVTTLAALDQGLATYDRDRVQGHRLSRAAIERLRDRLAALDVAGRAALPCLEPGRADLIVPGVAIVTATMDVLGADAVVVSDWGLREGIMADIAERPR